MELSIIIVNWNTKELLLRCLEALCQAAKRVENEIFVVDNGSTDGSVGAIREKFPEVKLIENPVNLGFAKANNQALSISGGRYLLLLNPDTQVKEEAIPEMLSFMEAHPDTGIVGAQLLNADGSKQNSIANFPSLATELLNKSFLRWLFPKRFPGKERDFSDPIEVDSVIGACMMVRRKAMEEVGLLDENYFLFMEETDWCYRMKEANWKIFHVPRAEVIHFQGKSAGAEKPKARVEYYRSRYHYFKKNSGGLQSLVLVMGLIVRLSVEVVFVTIACVFTLFRVKKLRTKLSTHLYLMWWHLRLCPREMGLKSNKKSRLSPLTKGERGG